MWLPLLDIHVAMVTPSWTYVLLWLFHPGHTCCHGYPILDIHVAVVTLPRHTCCCGYPILHMLVAMVTPPGHTCCCGDLHRAHACCHGYPSWTYMLLWLFHPGHTCCHGYFFCTYVLLWLSHPAHTCCHGYPILDIHVAMVTPPGHTCCCGYPILDIHVAVVTPPGHTCCHGYPPQTYVLPWLPLLDIHVAMVAPSWTRLLPWLPLPAIHVATVPPGHTCCRVSRAAPAHGCCCSRLHDTPVAVLPVAVHAFTPVLLRLPPPAHACRHGDPTLGCHGAPSRTRLPLLTRLPCVAVVTPSCTRMLSRFPVLRTHPHTRVAMATPALSWLLPWQPLRCPGCCHGNPCVVPVTPSRPGCAQPHTRVAMVPPRSHTHTHARTHTPVAMVTPYGRGRTPAARLVATATRCYGSPLLWLPVATVTGCHGYPACALHPVPVTRIPPPLPWKLSPLIATATRHRE